MNPQMGQILKEHRLEFIAVVGENGMDPEEQLR